MNPVELFQTMSRKFNALFIAIKHVHNDIVASGESNHGHGWDHDLTVAQYAGLIAETPRIGEMAWVAALMHSTDRHYEEEETARRISYYLTLLPLGEFSETELGWIREAVEQHSKLNSDDDNPVTVTLKDADRLGNLGSINIIRGGQHRPNIPACIPEFMGGHHPDSTYKNPSSCYDATLYNLEWEAMLRLPKARELAQPDLEFIRIFHRRALEKQREVGLYPWPSE